MSTPSICPLCSGTGKYGEKPCHACDGRGIVWPPEQCQPAMLPYPMPYTPPWYPYYPPWVVTSGATWTLTNEATPS